MPTQNSTLINQIWDLIETSLSIFLQSQLSPCLTFSSISSDYFSSLSEAISSGRSEWINGVYFPNPFISSLYTRTVVTQAHKMMGRFTDVAELCSEQNDGQGALCFRTTYLHDGPVLSSRKLGTESCLHLLLPKQQNWWTPFERKVENGREWIILEFGGMKLPVSTTKHPSRGVSVPERLPKETPGFEWIQHCPGNLILHKMVRWQNTEAYWDHQPGTGLAPTQLKLELHVLDVEMTW